MFENIEQQTPIIFKNTRKKISIIIPIYNTPEIYIHQCFNSIINQNLKDIEIICIDDGSTEPHIKRILDIYEKDKRFKIIRQNNQHAGPARNNGISESNSEFIYFLDPDDYIPNNEVLKNMYNYAKSDTINIPDMVGGNLNMFCCIPNDISIEEQTAIQNRFLKFSNCYSKYDEYKNNHTEFNVMFFQRYLFNADFIKNNNIKFPNYLRFEYPVFLAECLSKNPKIFTMKDDVYTYRVDHITKNNFNTIFPSLCGLEDCVNIFVNKDMDQHLNLLINEYNLRSNENSLKIINDTCNIKEQKLIKEKLLNIEKILDTYISSWCNKNKKDWEEGHTKLIPSQKTKSNNINHL